MRCALCGVETPLSQLTPLEINRCPACGAPEFTPMKLKGYWLFQPLGGGGMGSVYKALHPRDHRFFAVKVLPREQASDPDLVESLLREGQAGAALGLHPNIVGIADYGLAGDEYYMVSEFIEGVRLDNLIDDMGRLSESDALCCALQILRAESHIVGCGYLYRDLKPQNLLIEPNGRVRLFDYGLCVPLEEASNPGANQDKLEGSPYFTPPERVVGAAEGEYSEIYSLGMLMYLMLCGSTYYKKSEVGVLLGKHVASARFATVGARLKHCDPRTVEILDKMIARNPNARYHSLEALEQDMRELAQRLAPGAELNDYRLKLPEKLDEPKRKRSRLPLIALCAALATVATAALLVAYIFASDSPLAESLKDMAAKVLSKFLDPFG